MAGATTNSFTAEDTQSTLVEACMLADLDPTGAGLMRFGENAIYRLVHQPYVVRVARTTRRADVEKEVRVARWLAEAEFPAVRLANLPKVSQPLVVGGRLVTFWEFIRPGSGKPGVVDLARLLRGLHDLTPPPDLDLPQFDPFTRFPGRLAAAPQSVPREDVDFLQRRFDEVRQAYRSVAFELLAGPIHADAHIGNLLRAESGEAIVIDLEYFAFGPREWDLGLPAAYRYGLDWMSEADYSAFVDTYGYDVSQKPCFPVLRAVRELSMTVWLMQNVDESAEAAAEFRRRVSGLRNPNAPRRWNPF